MKELVQLVSCDICFKTNKEKVIADWEIIYDGKELALCDDHSEKIPLSHLGKTLREYGLKAQKPDQREREDMPSESAKKSKSLDPIVCPILGEECWKGTHNAGLSLHVRHKHPETSFQKLKAEGKVK